MASVTRVSNAALRASLRTPAFAGRASAFNAVRCYSAKTQVCVEPQRHPPIEFHAHLETTADNRPVQQTLKERFAEILPEKVEEIKALRKSVAS
jgi:citrate synthase